MTERFKKPVQESVPVVAHPYSMEWREYAYEYEPWLPARDDAWDIAGTQRALFESGAPLSEDPHVLRIALFIEYRRIWHLEDSGCPLTMRELELACALLNQLRIPGTVGEDHS